MKHKITCLKCANKGMDGRDRMYCTGVYHEAVNNFGFLWHKREGYKETPKWCTLQGIALKMVR